MDDVLTSNSRYGAARSTAEHPHEWSIEALRGAAAILVVLAHYIPLMQVDAGLLAFAYSGVDLFFVISGFVFGPYVFGKPILFLPFALRRFFRIYPTYVVALLAYVAIRSLQGQDTPHVWTHVFFLQTLESREIAFFYNPAFWSLPPEIEFYLFLPVLAALSAWRPVLFPYILACAFGVHFVIAFLSPSASGAVDGWFILGVHLPGLLVEFLVGAAAWKFTRSIRSNGVRASLIAAGFCSWLILAVAFVWLGGDGIAENPLLRGNLSLLAALAFALIVAGWVGMVRKPPSFLWFGALLAGNLSYGIYLFHNATPVLLQNLGLDLPAGQFVAACFLLTIVTAALVHYSIERPLRSAGRSIAAVVEQRFARTRGRVQVLQQQPNVAGPVHGG